MDRGLLFRSAKKLVPVPAKSQGKDREEKLKTVGVWYMEQDPKSAEGGARTCPN